MGELCARAAAAGVQVIIETHSDHVLDGARLAVRDRIVNKEDVSFHYLQQIDGKAVRTTPIIDDEGRLSEWPEGFFDQHRRNAARLTRPRR
jgi:predicted ATPase